MNSEARSSNGRLVTAKRWACGNPIRLPVALLTLSLVCVPVRPIASASPMPLRPRAQKGAELQVELSAHPTPSHRLSSDREIPALSALAEGWSQLDRRTHIVNTTNRGVTARVAVHEAGIGSRVLVCIHGIFSESTNWKYVAAALVQDYDGSSIRIRGRIRALGLILRGSCARG